MTVSIRTVDFENDRSVLISLLKGNRRRLDPAYPYASRFDWMYLRNPQGVASGWIAVDESSAREVGFTVALPREMSVCGQRVVAWNCADFSIEPQFRTLGVAAKLRRAAKDDVDAGVHPFLYAHPNDRMLAVHQRVGHTPIGQFHRHARLLSAEHKISPRLVMGSWLKSLLVATGKVMTLVDRARLSRRRYDVTLENDIDFSDEFDDLSQRTEAEHTVVGVRDRKYLDWRYKQNPLHIVDAVLARKDGRLVGYLLFVRHEDSIRLIDHVASRVDCVREMVLSMVLELRRAGRWGSLSIVLPEWSRHRDTFKALGFRQRSDSTSSVVVHASPGYEQRDVVLASSNWFMTVGDRDV